MAEAHRVAIIKAGALVFLCIVYVQLYVIQVVW